MTSATRGLRRAEFAVAAFGLTAFLLALLFVVDALRFHGDMLTHALSDASKGQFEHTRELVLVGLMVFDCFALLRTGRSLWRGVNAHRRLQARMPVVGRREIAGRSVLIVPGATPRAFCGGLLRPQIFVSEGAVASLGPAELAAVVAHEGHHADRRDPLRILIARAIGDTYHLGALSRREQALAELSADAEAVRRGGAAPLASALLAFSADIAPERVDRLAGAKPSGEVSRWMLAGAAVVIAALALTIAAVVLVPGHPSFCIPLGAAPGWILCVVIARLVALGPAWLGWRRAGLFLRPLGTSPSS